MESNIRYMIFYYFFSPSEMFLWKLDPQGVFVKDNLCNIPGAPLLTWISNYIHYKVWDKITYPTLFWACDYLSMMGLKGATELAPCMYIYWAVVMP